MGKIEECLFCGEPFEKKNPNQKYCCDNHCCLAQKERDRKKYAATRTAPTAATTNTSKKLCSKCHYGTWMSMVCCWACMFCAETRHKRPKGSRRPELDECDCFIPRNAEKPKREGFTTIQPEPLNKPVAQLDATGVFMRAWPNSTEAARALGCSSHAIGKACRGGYPVVSGYKWRYAEPHELDTEGA